MQKLELTWIGKGSEPAVEPRILLHDASKDYGDPAADNMLIHGDNLLALALERICRKGEVHLYESPYSHRFCVRAL